MADEKTEHFPPGIETLLEDIFFRKAHWHSAYEVAVQRLAQAIKLGALKPGSRLPPERELVERLGVSRTTLREGMRALQQQGYLTTSRGRSGGTFIASREVRPLTKAEVQRVARSMERTLPDLLDMRSAVEPKAAELAAIRADDQAIENLQWLLHRSKGLPTNELRAADSTLHIAIAHAADSDHLLDLVLEEQMRLHELLAYLSSAPALRTESRYSADQHGRIVEAIAARDAMGAWGAMRDHIQATHEVLMELLQVKPSSRPLMKG